MADPDQAKINNFVSRARQVAPQLLELLADLDGLSAEWFANGYNLGGANEILESDLAGDNQAITVAQLQNLMFTIDTTKNAVDGGHRSNLWVAHP